MDMTDVEQHLNQMKLVANDFELFSKWYTLNIETSSYNLSSKFLESYDMSDNIQELTQLLTILRTHLPPDLVTKYVQTIQQSEIEFVLKHIEPSSIIWLNLTELNSTASVICDSTATVLDLQSNVLAHNYREFPVVSTAIEELMPDAARKLIELSFNLKSNNSNETAVGEARKIYEFLQTSIISLVDIHVCKLNKKQVSDIASSKSNVFLIQFYICIKSRGLLLL